LGAATAAVDGEGGVLPVVVVPVVVGGAFGTARSPTVQLVTAAERSSAITAVLDIRFIRKRRPRYKGLQMKCLERHFAIRGI
jgi:hypothetical protein